MSDAYDLLNTLSEDEIAAYIAEAEIEPHIIIDKNRHISVPDELKRIAVQFDHNVETVTFDCPRYWDEHDMSQMKVYINYIRSDGEPGCYEAENVAVDEADNTIMHFTWTISKNVTMVSGTLTFLVCIKKADTEGNEEIHWNSERNSETHISQGLECGEAIEAKYPDILDQWEQEILESVTEKSGPQTSTITLFADGWTGEGELYSQVVEIEGVTENSKVDLQPTPEQITEMVNSEISMTTTNNDGVITVYAIGSAPTTDMTIQVLITEVVRA